MDHRLDIRFVYTHAEGYCADEAADLSKGDRIIIKNLLSYWWNSSRYIASADLSCLHDKTNC